MSRPLLLACTEVYPGPWVPTVGLVGVLSTDGMVDGEDEVIIHIRDLGEREEDTIITIDSDVEMRIDLTAALIRANRTKSSGSEVSVWLS